MVFPVVIYGCESWTVKKAEHRRIDAFELWCWRRLLRVPWTTRRSNQSILKDISPAYSLEGLMLKLKLQYFVTPWTAARQASLSITNSRTLPKLMSIKSVMPSSHLILCCPLLLLPSIFSSIRVFSSESVLCIRWPKYWSFSFSISSVQFSSVTQSCPILCDPMNHSMPGLPVYHQLLEFTPTHVHRVGDAIQPSHPLSSPSPPAFNLSHYQGLFQ